MVIEKKSIDELMQKADKLPPLPAIATRALRLMRMPDFSMKELADLLATDITISTTLLRWANSSFYSLSSPVSSVHHAVSYLGANVIRSLVLSAALINFMDKPLPGYNLDKGELWRHSLGMAIGARLIMQKFGKIVAEEAYTAGLIADVGKLVFEVDLREANLDLPELEGKNFAEIETFVFGIDHAEMGAEMAKRWEFPASLQEAIHYHHRPLEARNSDILACSVHVADALITSLNIGVGRDGASYKLDPRALKRLGLNLDNLEVLTANIKAQFEETEGREWSAAENA